MITVLFGRKSYVLCTAAVTDYSRNMPLRRTAPYLEKTFENTAGMPPRVHSMRRVFLFCFYFTILLLFESLNFSLRQSVLWTVKKTDVLRSWNLFLAPLRSVIGSGCPYCFGGLFFCRKFTKLDNNSCSTQNTAADAPTNNTNKTTRLSDPRSNRIAESVHCFISFLFFPYPLRLWALSPIAFVL